MHDRLSKFLDMLRISEKVGVAASRVDRVCGVAGHYLGKLADVKECVTSRTISGRSPRPERNTVLLPLFDVYGWTKELLPGSDICIGGGWGYGGHA